MRNKFLLDVALHHAVRNLVGHNFHVPLRFFHLGGVIVANTGIADFPLFNEPGHCLHRFGDRCLRIRPVNLVKINVVRPKPTETVFAFLNDTVAPRIAIDVNFLPGVVPTLESEVDIYRYARSEEHTSELQSRENLVCRLLLEKKNTADPASTVPPRSRSP